jgi:prepilin-type N-terminal cleavage/methylation domain-containing protein/prepilin-type processing-associated H-X9-DG protein
LEIGKGRTRGFSLLEVLIVISLIARLMPVLSKSREAARTAQCLSNQRQLNVAMLSYVDASKDFIPPWCYNDQVDFGTCFGSDRHIAWMQRLTKSGFLTAVDFNSVNSTAERVCPSVVRRGIYPINNYSYNDAFGYYAMDIYMTGYFNTGVTVYKGRRLSGIERHSDVYTITDTEIWENDNNYYNLGVLQARSLGRPYAYGAKYRKGASSYGTPVTDLMSHRHESTKVNFTFIDGHGKTIYYVADYAQPFGLIHLLDWNRY